MKGWLRNKLAIVLIGTLSVGLAAAWPAGEGLGKRVEE